MRSLNKSIYRRRRGTVLVISMIFLVVFSTLAVAMAAMLGTNTELASNHHKVGNALSAAESGLECGRYIIADTLPHLPETAYNMVTVEQANQVWNTLCTRIQAQPWVNDKAEQTESQIMCPSVHFGDATASFRIQFIRLDTHNVALLGIGSDGQVTRRAGINMTITKDNEVLKYAVASRGRMWLTGQSTIHGDIFSSWDRPEISPFNMTNDTAVLGTVNTVLTLDQIESQSYQMETLDENGNPIDIYGNPLCINYEDRYYSSDDEIQAYHEGINYGQLDQGMAGMDISDYNTDGYLSGLTNIPTCPSDLREVEYFPHAPSDKGAIACRETERQTVHGTESSRGTSMRIRRSRTQDCRIITMHCSETVLLKVFSTSIAPRAVAAIIITSVLKTVRSMEPSSPMSPRSSNGRTIVFTLRVKPNSTIIPACRKRPFSRRIST